MIIVVKIGEQEALKATNAEIYRLAYDTYEHLKGTLSHICFSAAVAQW